MLREIDEALSFDPLSRVQFRIPVGEGAAVSLLHELGRVLDIRYSDEFCDVEADVPESLRKRLAAFLKPPSPEPPAVVRQPSVRL